MKKIIVEIEEKDDRINISVNHEENDLTKNEKNAAQYFLDAAFKTKEEFGNKPSKFEQIFKKSFVYVFSFLLVFIGVTIADSFIKQFIAIALIILGVMMYYFETKENS